MNSDGERTPSDTQRIDVKLDWSIHVLRTIAADPLASSEFKQAVETVCTRAEWCRDAHAPPEEPTRPGTPNAKKQSSNPPPSDPEVA